MAHASEGKARQSGRRTGNSVHSENRRCRTLRLRTVKPESTAKFVRQCNCVHACRRDACSRVLFKLSRTTRLDGRAGHRARKLFYAVSWCSSGAAGATVQWPEGAP